MAKTKYKKRLAILNHSMLILALLITTYGVVPMKNASAASYNATVNPNVQYQTWEGWGTSLAWWANRVGGASESVRNDYADKLFGSNGLQMNIVRYNIGGGENPAYPDHMELRARIPGFKDSATAAYDWTRDSNQRSILQAAKSRIPASEFIAEAFSNSPPWWMTKSGSVTGNTNAAENLKDDMYDDFADYLTTVTKQFRDQWGVNFRTLSAFNEPSSDYWYFGNRQEGNVMFAPNQQVMIGQLSNAIAAKGLPIGISAPEETSIDLTRQSIDSYSAATKSKLAQYNTHTYQGSDRTGLNTSANGKRLWNSEHGDGDDTGMTLSRTILSDLKYMKNSAWVYWQAVETPGGWGMIETDLNNASANLGTYTVKKKYHMMAQWSKFIRPGYKIIDIVDNNSVAAYDTVGKKLVIVTVNSTTSPNTVNYDLSQFTTLTGNVTGYRTSSSENMAAISGLSLANKKFTNTQPANSVSTFVITGISGATGGGTTIDTNAYYKIVNQNSNKLLDVSEASTADGANVIQWMDIGGTNQQWKFVATTNGYYKLINRKTGKALEVSAQSVADGGDVIQWTDNGGTNQQWKPVFTDNTLKLVNRNSNKVADISSGSTSNGGDVIQWTDNGGTNQKWILLKATD